MKYNKIFALIAAVTTLFVACDQKNPDEPTEITPNIRVSPIEVVLPSAGGSESVSLNANLDWSVSGVPDWLEVSPESGQGSLYKQSVTVTAKANASAAREAVLTFLIEGGSYDLNVKQESAFGPYAPDGALFFASFKDGFGGFVVDNVTLTGALKDVWTHDQTYQCMKATAYTSGSSHESESWLVSPEIDLSGQSAAYFTFEHAGKYFNDMPSEISAWVSKDGGEWNELKIAEDHYSSNFVFIEAGVWNLADYVGSKVKFGFKFTSSAAKSGTWELRNVAVVAGAPIPAVDPTKTDWLELPATDDSDLQYFSHRFKMDGQIHRNFSFAWSQKDLLSVWVAYPLCKTHMEKNVERTDEWAYDPILGSSLSSSPSSYYAGDYDRGHQLPSADRLCNATANRQTFYGTNIIPQLGTHNTGVWGKLETQVRNIANKCDTAYVVTGGVVEGAKEISEDSDGKAITIPVAFFKAVLSYTKGGNPEWASAGFYTKHEGTGGSDVKSIAMTIDELEQKLGMDFFVNLEGKIGKDQAAAVEAQDPAGLL